MTKKGNKDEDLKPETVNEILLALRQNNMPLATALVFDNLDCSLREAKKIAESIKKRVLRNEYILHCKPHLTGFQNLSGVFQSNLTIFQSNNRIIKQSFNRTA
jgi:hypothetical protein